MVVTQTTLNETNENAHLVRGLVTVIGQRAAGLYEKTLDASPELVKTSVGQVEGFVTPYVMEYKEPVLQKWQELGDPLLEKLDETVASRLVPTAKAAVHKTEDLWKATEQTVEQVRENVVSKPYNYVSDVASRNKEYVEKTTRSTYDSLLTHADNAVDKLLPEVETSSDSASDSSSDAAKLSKKVSGRIYNKAAEVYAYSTERASAIVHIDLIAYAKETVGADDAKLAKAFDRVVDMLPAPEVTRKFTANLVDRLPKSFQPVATTGAAFVAPAMDYTFAKLSAFIFFVRSFVVPATTTKTQDPSPSQAETAPAASEPMGDSGVMVDAPPAPATTENETAAPVAAPKQEITEATPAPKDAGIELTHAPVHKHKSPSHKPSKSKKHPKKDESILA